MAKLGFKKVKGDPSGPIVRNKRSMFERTLRVMPIYNFVLLTAILTYLIVRI